MKIRICYRYSCYKKKTINPIHPIVRRDTSVRICEATAFGFFKIEKIRVPNLLRLSALVLCVYGREIEPEACKFACYPRLCHFYIHLSYINNHLWRPEISRSGMFSIPTGRMRNNGFYQKRRMHGTQFNHGIERKRTHGTLDYFAKLLKNESSFNLKMKKKGIKNQKQCKYVLLLLGTIKMTINCDGYFSR